MKNIVNKLPKELKDLIRLASRIASIKRMPVYLVGGFVRDLLLGVGNLDLDIVVEGSGIEFAEELADSLKARLIRHRRFGTATILYIRGQKTAPFRVRINNGRSVFRSKKPWTSASGASLKPHLKIDIASARREFYPEPAHLPVVSPGTLKDDLFRRDFTINSMAISINRENFGKLIDFFKGKPDLDNKKIRILHKVSFIDDPTRILRAIRFETRYDFRIEPETLQLLKKAIRQKMLEKVHPQRTRDDLILMLKEKHPLREIRRLDQLVGFDFISPHTVISKKTYTLLNSLEKEINWFKNIYHNRRLLDSWLMYFMGLIDSLDTRKVKDICRKFAFRKGEEKRILSYKNIKDKLISGLNRKEVKPSKIFSFFEPLSYEVILLLKAKYNHPRIQKHIEDFFKYYNSTRICICGEDLYKLGMLPGPGYKKIFSKVMDAKLNGLVRTKREELLLIEKLIKKAG